MNYKIKMNKLKAFRAENGLTQSDMAKILGMSSTSYSAKENGKREFTHNEIKRAKEYGLDIMYYFFNQK